MAKNSAFLVFLLFSGILCSVNSFTSLNEAGTSCGQTCRNSSKTFDEYLRTRNDLIKSELETSFGSDIKLSRNEELANQIIMSAK